MLTSWKTEDLVIRTVAKIAVGMADFGRLARMPKACAIKATAHHLARLIYAMLTQGQAYIEHGIDRFESEHRDKQLRQLRRKAAQFGLVLTEKAA